MPIHLPTILIIAGLILFFGLLLYSFIRDKKKGKSSCGGCCSSCAMGCHCSRSFEASDTNSEENQNTNLSPSGCKNP